MIEALQGCFGPRIAFQLLLLLIAGGLFNMARKLK